MSPPKPEERRRRYHKRSRNGCIDCKRKHIRCDEKKPLWKIYSTNCLIKGDSCGYADIKEVSPQPSSVKLEDDEYWDSGDGAAPLQGMSSSHLLVGGHQPHVQQGGSPHAGYGFDSYGHGDAGAHHMADDPLSRQGYYWGQTLAPPPDIPTTAAMGGYTIGSQHQQQPPQQQLYSWSDPTAGGQAAASYWDPSQQGSPAPAADHHHGSGSGRHHGSSSKHSSRRDGSGRSRR
ncbi:hypothetical protein SLS62_009044 [Diatrype stigma]|uniref:Zn(2)-C6 fungal-type domain-containing protein n=1 Tax=Diatrype stigma TaxID=117547 RepID=A0AAN9YJR0_9PEZI